MGRTMIHTIWFIPSFVFFFHGYTLELSWLCCVSICVIPCRSGSIGSSLERPVIIMYYSYLLLLLLLLLFILFIYIQTVCARDLFVCLCVPFSCSLVMYLCVFMCRHMMCVGRHINDKIDTLITKSLDGRSCRYVGILLSLDFCLLFFIVIS